MTMLQAASFLRSTSVTGGIHLYRYALSPISTDLELESNIYVLPVYPYQLNQLKSQLMVKRSDRRAPEINLGYYARVAGVRLVMLMAQLNEKCGFLRNTLLVLLATHAR